MSSILLATLERQQLTAILMGLPEFKLGRQAVTVMLTMSGLGQLIPGLQFTDVPRIDAGNIVNLLERKGHLEEDSTLHALGALLRYVLSIPELSQNDAHYVAELIVRYRLIVHSDYLDALRKTYSLQRAVTAPNISPSYSSTSMTDRLQQRRGQRDVAEHPLQSYQLDHDLILRKHDLVQQVAHFVSTIEQNRRRASIIPFSLCSEEPILSSYLLPRLVDELGSSLGIFLTERPISIAQADWQTHNSGFDLIQHRLQEIYDGACFVDLVEDAKVCGHAGCLLSIVNYGLPSATINSLATSFHHKAEMELGAFLREQHKLLVVCWINLRDQPPTIHDACCLPTLEELDVELVATWFEKKLVGLAVHPTDIQQCMRNLRKSLAYSRGMPASTYLAMENELKRLTRVGGYLDRTH